MCADSDCDSDRQTDRQNFVLVCACIGVIFFCQKIQCKHIGRLVNWENNQKRSEKRQREYMEKDREKHEELKHVKCANIEFKEEEIVIG